MWSIVANLLSINSQFQDHEYLVLEMMGKNKDPKWTDWHQRKSCCCSVAESCQTLWDFMDCSILGLPLPHYVPEFAQVHAHWIGDVIQASHLESPLDSRRSNQSILKKAIPRWVIHYNDRKWSGLQSEKNPETNGPVELKLQAQRIFRSWNAYKNLEITLAYK